MEKLAMAFAPAGFVDLAEMQLLFDLPHPPSTQCMFF